MVARVDRGLRFAVSQDRKHATRRAPLPADNDHSTTHSGKASSVKFGRPMRPRHCGEVSPQHPNSIPWTPQPLSYWQALQGSGPGMSRDDALTPHALVEGSQIAMFSASIGGGSRGTTSYRAGTPSYTSSEGPARLSLSLFTDTRPRRNLLLLPREGCANKVFLAARC